MTVASHSDALSGTSAPLRATVLCMRGYQPLESHRLRAEALASAATPLAATFTTGLNRGDHAIFSDTTYIAAYRLLNQILPEWTIRSIRRSTHGSSTAA